MDDWNPRANEIFAEALDIEAPQERLEFLERSCGGDEALRAAVTRLLESHEKAGSFLERPALDPSGETNRTVDIDPRAMEAGLVATFNSNAAVVIGNAGHSVLKSLGKQLPKTPHVVLRDGNDEKDKVFQPGSPELPTAQDDSRYQLHGEIARGGMGAIIKGRDTDLGRELAIKVLLDSHKDKPEVLQRFVEEAQIGGQLQHPGIVPVYELGQFGDQRPFFTMKLVKGETLAALLAKRKDPSDDLPKLLGIFEQICQTMAYTHSKGVIHRDLKPANIMVGAFGEVQVMDWGLAKVLGVGGVEDEKRSLDKQRNVSVIQTRRGVGSDVPGEVGSQTQMGSVMGTPAYMPPEQALGEIGRLDERADVFGLGAILCEILTGEPPYVGEDGTQVFRLASRGKLDDCFARLEESGVDEELAVLVRQALASEPGDRQDNAGVVAEGVTEYLTGVQDRLKASELARAKAQTRRQLSVAIAALMLVIAIGSAWAAANFRQQREAQKQLTEEKTALADRNAALAELQTQLAADKTVLAGRNAELAQDERRAREEAEDQLRISTVMRLAARAEIIRGELPVQSALLSIEAVELAKQLGPQIMPIASETLLSASLTLGGQPLARHTGRLGRLALSPNDRWLVTCSQNSPARLWDLWEEDLASAASNLSGDHGSIRSAVFSPDGNWLVAKTLIPHNEVLVWDFTTLPLAAPRVLRGHTDGIWTIAISPNSRWIGTGCMDGTARLWDLNDADPSSSSVELLGHTSFVVAVAFTPDGSQLVTGSRDQTARVWDRTGPSAKPLVLPHNGFVEHVAFVPNQRHIVTGCKDGNARVWDLAAQHPEKAAIVLPHDGAVSSMAFAPDGRLITGSQDKKIRLWDLSLEQPANSAVVLDEHEGGMGSTAIAPDGHWLATGSADGTVRLWDLLAAKRTASFVLRGHEDTVNTLAVTSNGRWLVTGSWDGTARLWDLKATNPASSLIINDVRAAAASSDHRRLVTSDQDGLAKVWDLTSEFPTREPSRVWRGLRGNVSFLALDNSGRWLVSVADHIARLIDLRGDRLPVELDGRLFDWPAVAFSADSHWLATAGEGGTARLWDLTVDEVASSGKELPGHTEGILALSISPDNRWLVTASLDDTARVWDLREQDMESSTAVLHGHPHNIFKLAISPDSRRIATCGGSWDKTVRVWELPTRDPSPESLHVFEGFGMALSSAAFSPDGRWLAAASWDEKCRLYDLEADDPTAVVLQGHDGALNGVIISADSRWLVTGSEDSTLRVFDLAAEDPGLSPLVLRGHESTALPIAFTSDNRHVVTRSEDNTVRLWPLEIDELLQHARQLVGRELTPTERRRYYLESKAPAQAN